MIRYILDTNICVELIRGRGKNILKKLRKCQVGDAGISTITLAELEYGVEKSIKPEQNRIALTEFCAPLEIVSFDDEAAGVYGRIRAKLERIGKIIGSLDMLIAAHAIAEDAVLITNNEREFRRIENLPVENWT